MVLPWLWSHSTSTAPISLGLQISGFTGIFSSHYRWLQGAEIAHKTWGCSSSFITRCSQSHRVVSQGMEEITMVNVSKTMPCLPTMTGHGFYRPSLYNDFGDGPSMALFYPQKIPNAPPNTNSQMLNFANATHLLVWLVESTAQPWSFMWNNEARLLQHLCHRCNYINYMIIAII